jgi:hypothetical protein
MIKMTRRINDRDNEMSLACRDEGQIILTKRRFVNRGVRLCPRVIAPAQLSEIKNVSFLIGFLN